MSMVGDNEKGKKGFSGLSSLATELSGVSESIEPETKAKPSVLEQPPQPQESVVASEQDRNTAGTSGTVGTVSSGDNDTGGSTGKWFFGFVAVILVILFINDDGQSNTQSSYSSSSSQNYSSTKSNPAPVVNTPAPVVKTPAPVVKVPNVTLDTTPQYIEPPIGTKNLLSIAQIRWCVREAIAIDAMRNIVTTNKAIDKFNVIINDYNRRCASYQYRPGALSRANREVEPYRSQIVSEAIRRGRQLEQKYSSVSTRATNTPKKPSAQYTREAQQLLQKLGYNPGPVDGQYGRRTADAVRAFQRNSGITQNGWIDMGLLSVLRRAAYQRSTFVPANVELRTSTRRPANAYSLGGLWYCNSGYRKSGGQCVSINAPANSYSLGDQWYCNSGYRKSGGQCVSINAPANSYSLGDQWYCNSGYRKSGGQCVNIHAPANSYSLGDQWYCNYGYRKSGGKCVSS